MNNEELPFNLKAIEDYLPKTLDEIVRTNRHCCSIRLSTEKEIEALERPLVALMEKDSFTDWRLICLDRAEGFGGMGHILHGFAERKNSILTTSMVVAIDKNQGLVVTQSGSIYRLKDPAGQGEPEPANLFHLCCCLNAWGWGDFLGIPPLFY